MNDAIKNFWIKLIFVLLPFFIVGFVNAVLMYENQRHMEKEMDNKVNNDVLLQYMELNKEIQEAIKEDVHDNSDKLKILEKKMDDFIIQYISFKSNQRGVLNDEIRKNQSDLYEFYVENNIDPFLNME